MSELKNKFPSLTYSFTGGNGGPDNVPYLSYTINAKGMTEEGMRHVRDKIELCIASIKPQELT